MPKITIKSDAAHGVFHSMLEGMWENARDDNETARVAALDALAAATPGFPNTVYPVTFDVSDDVAGTAMDVRDNCLENASDGGAADMVAGFVDDLARDIHNKVNPESPIEAEDSDDYLHPGDVVIDPEITLDMIAAISGAIEKIELIDPALELEENRSLVSRLERLRSVLYKGE
jgi:hypothetical protein